MRRTRPTPLPSSLLMPSLRVKPQVRSPSRAENWYEPPNRSGPPLNRVAFMLSTDWRVFSRFRITFTTTA